MTAVALARGAEFLQSLLAVRGPLAVPELDALRALASDRLTGLRLPTTHDETWRYTDLSGLLALSFTRSSLSPSDLEAARTLRDRHALPEAAACLVFVNGTHVPALSILLEGEPATVAPLSALTGDLRDRVLMRLGTLDDPQDVFAALNAACLEDVAVVYLPPRSTSDRPIQVLFLSVAAEGSVPASHARCLIVAEPHSQGAIVETHAGSPEATYFTNAVTEVFVGEGARLDAIRVQQESPAAYHLGSTRITQERGSTHRSTAVTLGAKLSRHTPAVAQQATGTETHLYGLACIGGDRLADTHSTIAHNFPHGTSQQLHKCVVADRAHGVFGGLIRVAKDAQQTDSRQLSRNLLLSPKARVETKPQLEILADDVKCAHGATVSQIDAEAVFYLQSRGIDATTAAILLTRAFAGEVTAKIAMPTLREQIDRAIAEFVANAAR